MCSSNPGTAIGTVVGTAGGAIVGGGVGAVVGGAIGGGVGSLFDPGSPDAPNAPTLPQYPAMTQEETDAIKKAGLTLDQVNQMISDENINSTQTQTLLKGLTGLYDSSGNLDQNAVATLRGKIQATTTQQANLGQQALDYLGSFFGSSTVTPEQQAIFDSENARLKGALEGTLPVSEALKQQTAKEFQTLQESAGRRGIRIEGDNLDAATSESTAGIRIIEEARKRTALAQDTERQNIINTGMSQNLSNLGFLENVRTNNLNFAGSLAGNANAATSSTLGFLDAASTANTNNSSNLINQLLGLSGATMDLTQPYTAQRLGTFNQSTNQATLDYQAALAKYQTATAGQSSLLGGIGSLTGQLGSAYLLSGAQKTPTTTVPATTK